MLNRMRQGLNFIYCVYTLADDEMARRYLSQKEYDIFIKMSDYDKVHSIEVLKMVLEDKELHRKREILKLALLHDCGKGNAGLFRRVKKVLVGDKELEAHAEMGYELLKDINLKVATLVRKHHLKGSSGDLRKFQKIDDFC